MCLGKVFNRKKPVGEVGQKVSITSENHPVEAVKRKSLVPGAVSIKRDAWFGTAASIMPDVTIGANAVVAAGAVVTKDVLEDTVSTGESGKRAVII